MLNRGNYRKGIFESEWRAERRALENRLGAASAGTTPDTAPLDCRTAAHGLSIIGSEPGKSSSTYGLPAK